MSGSAPATRGCRSLEGVGLLGGNEPLEELGALAETPASGLARQTQTLDLGFKTPLAPAVGPGSGLLEKQVRGPRLWP